MNAAAAGAALLGAGLLVILGLKLQSGNAPPPQAGPVPHAAPSTAPPVPSIVTRSDPSDTMHLLLARPLFSATRRPPDGPTAVEGPVDTLPRMTAILIVGSRRSVIFAPADGKPVVVAEGGQIGSFTVERIGPQEVEVRGPQGMQTVRTSFDMSPPAPWSEQPLRSSSGDLPSGSPFSLLLNAGSGLSSASGVAR